MGETNPKKTKNSILMLLFVIVAVAVAIGLFYLFKPKETYISDDGSMSSISSLYCSSNNPAGPFFSWKDALGAFHEVKVTYRDKKIDKLSYTYTGTFPDHDTAKTVSSLFHADYNIYMGKTSVYQEDLSPNFSDIDNKLIINLYFDKDETLVPETAQFVFLDSNDLSRLDSYSVSTLEKIYKSKGFSCEFNE